MPLIVSMKSVLSEKSSRYLAVSPSQAVSTNYWNEAAAVREPGGRVIEHARYYWVASGGESAGATAVWQHTAEDRDAAAASRISLRWTSQSRCRST
jgi:hypothetical protein